MVTPVEETEGTRQMPIEQVILLRKKSAKNGCEQSELIVVSDNLLPFLRKVKQISKKKVHKTKARRFLHAFPYLSEICYFSEIFENNLAPYDRP
jgi:hypothetical protein